jgi:CAP12/Pycsar effector protein, TIR domain
MRPTLFIGSSTESLDIAYAAQSNLEDVAEVLVWTQGIFELTKSYLESLLDALDDTEFGLFIFQADDVTKIRGTETRTTRDNVVFELGLFIGRLGREHTYILIPKGISDFHLPSDLLGISTATFQPPSKPERMQAALGPACHQIRDAIRKQMASAPAPLAAGGDDIRLVLPALIPEPERKHLLNIAHGKTQSYQGRGSLRSELRHLLYIGLIRKHPGRLIGEFTSGNRHDLADIVELTDLGKEWVAKLEK